MLLRLTVYKNTDGGQQSLLPPAPRRWKLSQEISSSLLVDVHHHTCPNVEVSSVGGRSWKLDRAQMELLSRKHLTLGSHPPLTGLCFLMQQEEFCEVLNIMLEVVFLDGNAV